MSEPEGSTPFSMDETFIIIIIIIYYYFIQCSSMNLFLLSNRICHARWQFSKLEKSCIAEIVDY